MRTLDLDLDNSSFSHDLGVRGVKGPLAPDAALHVAVPVSRQGRHTEVVISELNTWPVCTPVNASPASLRMLAHDSGPRWCPTPFLCGSLIRYSLPVYPGAFLNIPYASTGASTRGDIIRDDPDLVKRYLSAQIEAIALMKRDRAFT